MKSNPSHIENVTSLLNDDVLENEEDIQALEELNLSFADLMAKTARDLSLLDLAKEKNNQLALDYFYSIIAGNDLIEGDWTVKDYWTERFRYAVYCNQSEMTLESLLEHKPDINSISTYYQHSDGTEKGTTSTPPLIIAVRDNNERLVRFLAANGAYLEISSVQPGSSPALYLALERGYHDIAETLVKCGANVNGIKSGRQYIAYAVMREDLAQVNWLLDHGAIIDFDYEEEKISKTMHIAARTGNFEIFELLAESGAELNISYMGNTLLDIAIKNDHYKIANYLMEKEVEFDPHLQPKWEALVAAQGKSAVEKQARPKNQQKMFKEVNQNKNDKAADTSLTPSKPGVSRRYFIS